MHTTCRAGSARGSARHDKISSVDKRIMKQLILAVNKRYMYRKIIFFWISYFLKSAAFYKKGDALKGRVF